MQELNRRKRNKTNQNIMDNSIVPEDGIYSPTVNRFHQQSLKAGQSFSLYRGQIVRWILIAKN